MQIMSHKILNITIIIYILMICGCMSRGIDYNPSKYNDKEVYVSINENNFQIWLNNQKSIGGANGFYGVGACPNGHGHIMPTSN